MHNWAALTTEVLDRSSPNLYETNTSIAALNVPIDISIVQRVWKSQQDEWRSYGRFSPNNHTKVHKWDTLPQGLMHRSSPNFISGYNCIIADLNSIMHMAILHFVSERQSVERLKVSNSGVYNKKLCYSRGTARRTCQYRKACNCWTTLTSVSYTHLTLPTILRV